jgi:hypothetical protein
MRGVVLCLTLLVVTLWRRFSKEGEVGSQMISTEVSWD